MSDWWQGFLWGLAIAWLFSSSVTAFVLMLLNGTGERPSASAAGGSWRVRAAGRRELSGETAPQRAAPSEPAIAGATLARGEANPPSPFKVGPLNR